MHIREGGISEIDTPLFQRMRDLLQTAELQDGNGNNFRISTDAAMFNAGVIGIDSADAGLLDEVLDLTDQLCELSDLHVLEQFVFSYLLSQRTDLGEAGDLVFHYWPPYLHDPFRERLPQLMTQSKSIPPRQRARHLYAHRPRPTWLQRQGGRKTSVTMVRHHSWPAVDPTSGSGGFEPAHIFAGSCIDHPKTESVGPPTGVRQSPDPSSVLTIKKLSVVHWFPLEQYPPTTNMLDYFAADTDWPIDAFTCGNDRGLTPYENPGVRIHRRPFPSRSLNRLRRWIAYFAFPFIVYHLLKIRPGVLLYIEPHSALPAFLYCCLARRCRLFIHYHEYRDRQEYLQRGMRLVRLNHWLEKRFLYRRAEWISQTNADRNRMFREDLPGLDANKLKILPNYPPQFWIEGGRPLWRNCSDQPLRLVYVGAVSLRDTFIGPLIDWLRSSDSPDNVTLDVFSYNNDDETHRFLKASENQSIRFHARGVDYKDIPGLLVDYHVGLILYRANSRDYVQCFQQVIRVPGGRFGCVVSAADAGRQTLRRQRCMATCAGDRLRAVIGDRYE